MTGHLLSRVALRDDTHLRALAPLLLPANTDSRVNASHRLLWALFGDAPDRTRDFLWREEKPGRFLTLSARAPINTDGLFEIETRAFAPSLTAGQRLVFALRANPTTAVKTGPDKHGTRGKPVDVVMRVLASAPGRRSPGGQIGARAARRNDLLGWTDADEAARPALDWLERQGERHGFVLDRSRTQTLAYRRVVLDRSGAAPVVFGQVDYEGALTVTDPRAFADAVTAGLGRSKAFGCGMMLLARDGAEP